MKFTPTNYMSLFYGHITIYIDREFFNYRHSKEKVSRKNRDRETATNTI